MAITYAADVETDRMQAVLDQIDAGAGAGTMELGTTGMAATLATITLNDPAGTIAADVLTFSGFPKTVAATGAGDMAAAVIKDSDGNTVGDTLTVTATGGGGDITFDNVTVAIGQDVRVDNLSITHA